MRTLAIAMTLGIAAGCTPADVAFQHESTLFDDTRGLAFESDGTAQVGMVGNTCEVHVANAVIGQDIDVATSEDHVEDAFNGIVLVRGSDGLHLYDPMDYEWGGAPDIAGGDIVDGALVDTGVVAVTHTAAGLSVNWSGDLNASTAVAGSNLGGLSVDRTTGTAFVVSDGMVDAVGPDGSLALGGGDMAVWDSIAQVLYVADAGGNELRGIEADGGLRFATPLDGSASALETLAGQAVVSTSAGGAGQLVIIDGMSGEIVSSQPTPGAADSLETSESGNSMAVMIGRQAHFFRVRN